MKHDDDARSLTPDVSVLVAAAVLHLGEHLVTLDRGFRGLLPAHTPTVLAPTAP